MGFSDLMISVAPWLRLLIALVLTVGLSLLAVWRLHTRLIHLDDPNRQAKASHEAEQERRGEARAEAADTSDRTAYVGPPDTFYLGMTVRGLAVTAFVFLLAFTLGNFWGNASDARLAALDEAAGWSRSMAAAQALPDGQGQQAVITALGDYRASVAEVEWPLMQRADGDAAFEAHGRAGVALGKALLAAEPTDAGTAPAWGEITDAVPDMVSDGNTRIAQVPTSFAPAVIWLIAILALAQLALAITFQPARLTPNLVLIGVLAIITTLMLFVVIEASNPYVGGGAVQRPALLSSP